jgi:hypothetical protein
MLGIFFLSLVLPLTAAAVASARKKFIETELQKLRGYSVEEPEDPAAAKRRKQEEELYALPDNIKVPPPSVCSPGLYGFAFSYDYLAIHQYVCCESASCCPS